MPGVGGRPWTITGVRERPAHGRGPRRRGWLVGVGDTFLVIGATGRTGRGVADGLRARGLAVRAASRTSATPFDWDAPATWDAALTGATAAYVVTPERPDFRAAAVAAFTGRAVRAGVRRIVLLSGRSARHGSARLLDREAPVRGSGLAWTILRPSQFMQNFDAGPYAAAMRAGELRLPLGPPPGPRVDFVDTADIAAVAVAALTSDAYAGGVLDLSGPRTLALGEAVTTIAEATGRDIRYAEITPAAWLAARRAAGASDAAIAWSRETFAGLRRGDYATVHPDAARVLGRPPGDFAAYVRRTAETGGWRESV